MKAGRRTTPVLVLALLLASPALAQPDVPVAPALTAAQVPVLRPSWPALGETDRIRARVVRRLDWPNNDWRMPVVGGPSLKAGEADLADAHALLKPGVEPDQVTFAFERQGGQIARPLDPDRPRPARRSFVGAARDATGSRGAGGKPDALYVHVAAWPEEDGAVPIERAWFVFYTPERLDPDVEPEPGGLIVVMPGLLGTPEPMVEVTVQAMRRRGYAVLRLLAQPSRFLEDVTLDAIDPATREAGAARAADVLTRRAAGVAYAVEGMVARVLEERPGLRDLPRAILGMSGGAMTLPTTVAREPDAYDAAVLIAGGAHLLGISVESSYASSMGVLDLRWPGADRLTAPAGPEWEAFKRAYLERSSLDPYHTAPALVGKPVLIIHGALDRAVPAEYGDLLWERLGRPERWSSAYSHEGVFAALPASLGPLMDWIDRALQKRGAGAPRDGNE